MTLKNGGEGGGQESSAAVYLKQKPGIKHKLGEENQEMYQVSSKYE